jgi:hypothetical protein
MKTRSLYLLTALIGAVAFTVPWLTRLAAQNSPIGSYSMSEWAHYQLGVNRVLETGQVGKVIGYTGSGTIGVVTGGEVPEAPLGTLLYARSNANWQAFPPGLATMQVDAPDNGLWYSRRNGEWQNFLPGGGSGTNVGGTNRLKLAAMAEFRPPNTNGTLLPANTATFIKVNHIYDPDGVITAINTNTGSFRPAAGYYAITMVVPVSVAEQGPGTARIPFTIALFNLTTTNDVYYQTYTVYDEDLSQYNQVFLPALVTDGAQDFSIRVFNHSATLDLMAGQAGGVAGVDNHYTEIQFLKIDGIAGLPEAPINTSMYARSNADWVSFTIPSTNGFIGEAPLGTTNLYARSNGVWQAFVTGGSGGEGGRADAVIGQDTIEAMTNNIMPDFAGLERVMVSKPGDTSAKWFQAVNSGVVVTAPYFAISGGSNPVSTNPGDVSFTTDNAAGVSAGLDGATVTGRRYRCQFYASAPNGDVENRSEYHSSYTEIIGPSITPTPSLQVFEYTATGYDSGRTAIYVVNGVLGDTVTITGWTIMDVTDAPSEVTDYTTLYPSLVNGIGWQTLADIYPDAPADGQLYGRKTNGWAVVTGVTANSYQTLTDVTSQILPNAPTVVITLKSESVDLLTGEPVIPAGEPWQLLRIICDWTQADTKVQWTNDNGNDPLTGSNLYIGGSLSAEFFKGYIHDLLWDPGANVWVYYGLQAYAGPTTELLPAPWPPPDTNGVQLLSTRVKEQLLAELLPYLLERMGTNAPPGTAANPIAP